MVRIVRNRIVVEGKGWGSIGASDILESFLLMILGRIIGRETNMAVSASFISVTTDIACERGVIIIRQRLAILLNT